MNNKVDDLKYLIKKNSWRLDDLFQKYQRAYQNKSFILKEFLYEKNNFFVYAPFTLTESKNESELSYFGLPILFYGNELKNLENIKEVIKSFFEKNKNLKKKFIFEFSISSAELNQLNISDLNPYEIFETQHIDLSLDKNDIIGNLKPNLRNEIKKNFKEDKMDIRIIDNNNYTKNHILKMSDLHERVSKRKTRSQTTWLENERMIVSNKGFLVEIRFQEKLISSSLFFHNEYESYYFSSASLKDNLPPTGHVSIWEAIKHAKNIGLKRFNLGMTRIINSRTIYDKKIHDICFFKSRFCGVKNYIIALDNYSKLF